MNNYVANYKITERISILSGTEGAYTKELNLISWNGAAAKYDIRNWNPAGDPQKGITLTESEARALYEALREQFEK